MYISSRRQHTRYWRDWSSDVCSSDLFGGRLGALARCRSARSRRAPARSHDLHDRAPVEAVGRGPAQERQVALAYGRADVLGCAHVESVLLKRGELERLDPDLVLELRRYPTELGAYLVPDLLGLCGQGQSRPS